MAIHLLTSTTRLLLAATLLAGLAACSDGAGSPTQPSDVTGDIVADADTLNIGWWHEIVNDTVAGHAVSVTFCPLTGAGLVFDAQQPGGGRLELGVSGLLYNSNLVMFDRANNSLYPQIYGSGVLGVDLGQTLPLLAVVETTWSVWKQLYPNTLTGADSNGFAAT